MYEGLLESEGYVSPQTTVFYSGIFCFLHIDILGLIVSYVTNDVLSKGVVGAYAITLKAYSLEGIGISGVCQIGSNALVIVPQLPTSAALAPL